MSPERASDDSPPNNSTGSSPGNASPSLTSDPGGLNPAQVSTPSNENDDEVGMLCFVHVTGMTDYLGCLGFWGA
jgi:hypothetical protein